MVFVDGGLGDCGFLEVAVIVLGLIPSWMCC
jgi:hypothetical protein